MSDAPTINWTGNSGQKYLYYIYPIDASFKKEAGNYIFAKESKPNYWISVYIGQTKNLDQRIENHEKEECAKRNGATHIHAHLNKNESSRLSEEKDLILKWQPVCNEQLIR